MSEYAKLIDAYIADPTNVVARAALDAFLQTATPMQRLVIQDRIDVALNPGRPR